MLTSEKKSSFKTLAFCSVRKAFVLNSSHFRAGERQSCYLYHALFFVYVVLYKIEGKAGIAPRSALSVRLSCGKDVSCLLPCN